MIASFSCTPSGAAALNLLVARNHRAYGIGRELNSSMEGQVVIQISCDLRAPDSFPKFYWTFLTRVGPMVLLTLT